MIHDKPPRLAVTNWFGIHGPHSTQFGGMPLEVLAWLLLDELIDRIED